MLFREIAEFFGKIESVSSRLEMTDFVSGMLSNASPEEAKKIVYLSQGQLGPQFEGIDVGMGEKLVIGAIAKISGFNEREIEKKFKESGDLGLVAEEMVSKKKQSSLFSEKLSLEKVFENFLKITKAEGTGSHDLKIKLLAELLNSASEIEARYIARIPLQNLRLGIGDPTIMDALAINYLNEFKKSNPKIAKEFGEKFKAIKKETERTENIERQLKFRAREKIEEKYNIYADLGEITKALKEKGLKALDEIEIHAGIPIRPALAERLSSAEEIVKKLGKCAVEAKYDGLRCVTGKTLIYAKNYGLMPICNLKIGTMVLTHTGSFKRVIAKNRRKIDKNERLFKIQTFFGTKFKISEKHPVLVFRNNKEKWITVENLKKNDKLVFPIPKIKINKTQQKSLTLRTKDNYCKTISLDNKFFRFIGYWIGDGYTNEYHNTERIGLIFNEKTEKNLCSNYEKIVKKVFKIKEISKNSHNGAIYLYWRDQPMRKWLTENFRKNKHGKTLPLWFYNISKKQFFEFLKGWIEADGTTDKQNRTTITTKESFLAMFLQLMGLKFKKIVGIKKIKVKSKNSEITYNKLTIAKSKIKANFHGKKLLVKILRLEEIKYPDPRTFLFNLQIEKDESFCSAMISLHNCQIHKTGNNAEIFSRRMENMTPMFPEIAEAVKQQIKAKTAIFEGEALAFNELTGEYLPFQVTIQRKRKYDIGKMAEEFPLKLFAFDVLMIEGKSTMELPFHERRKKLHSLIGKGNAIELTKSIETDDAKKMNDFFNECVEKGLEGIIAKDLNAKYIAGARKFAWIKLKRSYKGELSDSIDAVIIGYFKGKGHRTQFGLGTLLVAVYNNENNSFESIAKIGTGMSESQLSELEKILSKIKKSAKPAGIVSEMEPDAWVEPKYVIEVRADEITKSPAHACAREKSGEGLALRFPRMISIRQDKKPEQATTTNEIISMFKMQKRTQLENPETEN